MIIQGDVLEVTKGLDDNTFDAMLTRICPICGREYYADPQRLKHGRQTTCSRECSYRLRTQKRSKGIKVKCATCGKEFRRTPSTIKSKHGAVYCSPDCQYRGRSLGLTKREVKQPYHRKPIAEWRIKECLICGSVFVANRRIQKYCSRECFEIAHRENMAGEKNPSFIDGRNKDKRTYRGEGWKWIRKAVYRRDGWVCQVCGKHCKSHEIQCHHIIPYRLTKDNSMENLITLCNRCHVKVEGCSREKIAEARIAYWTEQEKAKAPLFVGVE